MISTKKQFGTLLLGLSLTLGLTATILAPLPATAQGITTGGLTGVTVDPTEAVIPNTRIVALNVATGAKVEQQARADGGFSLLNLPAGSYTLTFSNPGFADLVMKDVQVSGRPRSGPVGHEAFRHLDHRGSDFRQSAG